jgi:DNA polymerase-3 subunit epsilon
MLTIISPTDAERRQARREAIAWAATLAAHPDVLFLDSETTGLTGQAEIVELAIVDGRGAILLDTLVRPDGPIPAEVIRIHGIDDAMVAGAPRWTVVYPQLLALLASRPVVVYNAEFDLRMVNQTNARHGFPPLPAAWHCAMRRYAAFGADWNAKYGNYRLFKLEAALAGFGHPPPGHRARADALGCRQVVLGMAGAR